MSGTVLGMEGDKSPSPESSGYSMKNVYNSSGCGGRKDRLWGRFPSGGDIDLGPKG